MSGELRKLAGDIVQNMDRVEREPRAPWDEAVYDSLLNISDALFLIARALPGVPTLEELGVTTEEVEDAYRESIHAEIVGVILGGTLRELQRKGIIDESVSSLP